MNRWFVSWLHQTAVIVASWPSTDDSKWLFSIRKTMNKITVISSSFGFRLGQIARLHYFYFLI